MRMRATRPRQQRVCSLSLSLPFTPQRKRLLARRGISSPPKRSTGSATTRRSLRACAAASKAAQAPLVVVGSVNADMVLKVERLPREGETLAAKDLQTFPGGKVGDDANADLLRAALREAGVDLGCLRTVPGPSGTAVILLQPTGENSIVIVGGANTTGWDVNDDHKQVLRSAGALLLQREIPEEVNLTAAKVAAEAGVRVVMDCGGVEGPIASELLGCVSILSPNETELARLTGMRAETREEVEAAAKRLMAEGVREAVLVKRGGQGSLLVTADGAQEQDIFKAEQVVDTTGAGDCFTGAYAVALLEGLSGQEALRFAAAAASVCVQREGAMTSLPSREEVTSLLQQGR